MRKKNLLGIMQLLTLVCVPRMCWFVCVRVCGGGGGREGERVAGKDEGVRGREERRGSEQ